MIFQAKACSLPPLPNKSIFMDSFLFLIGMLGDELDPVDPQFIFCKVFVSEFLQCRFDMIGFRIHKIIMERVFALFVHDVLNVVIDVKFGSAIDDLLDFLKQTPKERIGFDESVAALQELMK